MVTGLQFLLTFGNLWGPTRLLVPFPFSSPALPQASNEPKTQGPSKKKEQKTPDDRPQSAEQKKSRKRPTAGPKALQLCEVRVVHRDLVAVVFLVCLLPRRLDRPRGVRKNPPNPPRPRERGSGRGGSKSETWCEHLPTKWVDFDLHVPKKKKRKERRKKRRWRAGASHANLRNLRAPPAGSRDFGTAPPGCPSPEASRLAGKDVHGFGPGAPQCGTLPLMDFKTVVL